MLKLHGIIPPIATPFDHRGDLYKVKVQHNVEKWNRTGLLGYCVCGSTGESVFLTTEEKIQMWEWVAQYADSSKLLIAGTGVESVRETLALTNKAAEMGYKAAMVRTPHYYKNLINRTAAQMLYFRAVADQSKIPLIIYNWPQTTGVDIAVEAVVGLSEHPNIIAIKESSGNLEKVMQLIRERSIPFISTHADISHAATSISHMTVKTEAGDRDKIGVIQKLVQEHVQVDRIVELIQARDANAAQLHFGM